MAHKASMCSILRKVLRSRDQSDCCHHNKNRIRISLFKNRIVFGSTKALSDQLWPLLAWLWWCNAIFVTEILLLIKNSQWGYYLMSFQANPTHFIFVSWNCLHFFRWKTRGIILLEFSSTIRPFTYLDNKTNVSLWGICLLSTFTLLRCLKLASIFTFPQLYARKMAASKSITVYLTGKLVTFFNASSVLIQIDIWNDFSHSHVWNDFPFNFISVYVYIHYTFNCHKSTYFRNAKTFSEQLI